ncbi:hydantoinase/oxoprolinase family protein [Nitratireductor mangrovi]|uniref:Hydantoinase/oxoprolinase family protein n=1 Tax=Nitratireductor mangrovi TaxID=2599600 RepID=A0A5B8L056_9HYPH|nr:hydantoinase/oxoprolinase family protein [Nitratireductor mangrovi]QDZ01305.1 hydantoinase/oxoprolinase family protein [Nitratireductor mangrovi]
MNQTTYLVATDVGGTCTDTIVVSSAGEIHIGKALSTPPDFATGVLNSIRTATDAMHLSLNHILENTTLFIHGSTVVDNTVFTREGTRTGLIATAGFEDTLLVTRGAYGRWSGLTEEGIKNPVKTSRAPALLGWDAIVGVKERVDCDGDIIEALDVEGARKAIRHLVEDQKVEAIAVALLWSFFNPQHERTIRELVNEVAPGTYVTLSSDIAPVPGEYERTSTTVINAYAGRVTRDYLNDLESLLAKNGYGGQTMVMQGYGGLLPIDEAAVRAVGMIECGPAAGVIGAKFLGDMIGDEDIIAADMGGTTFKVGVIQNGELDYAREPMVDRFHYVAPKIDVVSIGAGGGSIIGLDPKTRLPSVGPQSAGSRPGPICYGLGGTEPTLTDVMMLIGYMESGHFLRGSMALDADSTRRIFKKKIADPLSVSVEEAAIGIYRIASAQITDLIRKITVERGLDPRDFVLHSFGGTCGMLASAFGEELSVRRIVIPYTASVNCAFGLVTADVRHEYSVTRTLPAEVEPEEINAIFAPIAERAARQLASEGFSREAISMNWSVDFRYRRQVHEVTTPVRSCTPLDAAGLKSLIADFESLYERKFGRGSAYREAGIEMTMFRLTARGRLNRPQLPRIAEGGADASRAKIGTRRIFVERQGDLAEGAIYDFERLEPGNRLSGPAVIHTPITTIAVQERQTARMDGYKNIVLEMER